MGFLDYGSKLPYKDTGKDTPLFVRVGTLGLLAVGVAQVVVPLFLFLGGLWTVLGGLYALPESWHPYIRKFMLPVVTVLTFLPVFLLGD